MAYEHKNVIVGAAALYVSVADSTSPTGWYKGLNASSQSQPVGPALPTFTANVSATAEGSGFEKAAARANWRHLGYTTDGVEVSYEPDYGDVVVDQALDAVKIFKQGMRVSVRTTLAEPTLRNLLLAWGQSNGSLGTVATDEVLGISSGQLGDDPVERSLAFVGPGPVVQSGASANKTERVYHVRRALQVESSAHSLSRQDATTLPVSFRCLPDSAPELATQAQEYGLIIQRTVASAGAAQLTQVRPPQAS